MPASLVEFASPPVNHLSFCFSTASSRWPLIHNRKQVAINTLSTDRPTRSAGGKLEGCRSMLFSYTPFHFNYERHRLDRTEDEQTTQAIHLWTNCTDHYYYCCCTVCTALLFSYSAIFIAASVRKKLIHSLFITSCHWTSQLHGGLVA